MDNAEKERRHGYWVFEPGVCSDCRHYLYIHKSGTCVCGCFREDCSECNGTLDE